MNDRKQQFAELHKPGDPLILYNIWDAGSALAVQRAGAKAIATGSLSVAGAQGYDDGEKLPFETILANSRNIVAAVDLPVTIDLESGYGADPAAVGDAVGALAETGAVGINLEDQDIANAGIRGPAEQALRVRAAAETGMFINARTDLFIQTPLNEHDRALAEQALERARAYADAGAGSFFIPFAADEELIGHICEQSPLPVNCMIMPDSIPIARMAELGVATLSYGPGPWMAAMANLEQQASRVYSG